MNLTKLFEMQKVLDKRIVEDKGLQGHNLLPEKILALQVELGECANEWRGFKFWSEKNEPIVRVSNPIAHGNPLLEEYVDCVHFFISIAMYLKINPDDFVVTCDYTQPTITQTFNRVFSTVSSLDVLMDPETAASISLEDLQETLHEGFSCFVGLGEDMGFTWNQIEQAYFDKNAINHTRQDTGY
ncbi:dUTPase [Sporosarcina sp. ANT_H38]|uniref:dUTP diphosphatase n=1 Tax=Sporosarcina sp. ANT_H38 TaxID=2597358 RepID=UPI0011F17E34|nr:dUTP diphosphatase [Sporosarcina sp. ANT_H38]KAA0944172.1 dUTPase [Sporosarcina sp. ANT_H38]